MEICLAREGYTVQTVSKVIFGIGLLLPFSFPFATAGLIALKEFRDRLFHSQVAFTEVSDQGLLIYTNAVRFPKAITVHGE